MEQAKLRNLEVRDVKRTLQNSDRGRRNVKTHDYTKYADEYAGLGFEGTFLLAFRDIPELLHRHVKGRKALDYGCGAGRSTRYLKTLDLEVMGVDISGDMLSQARQNDPSGQYIDIQSGQLPFPESCFDLIFSSFVFLEIPTLAEMEKILAELKRVLKHNGVIVFVTGSNDFYKGNWVSVTFDFPENHREVRSGETVKVLIKGTDVVLYDYYWTEDDYAKTAERAGLRIRDVLIPLGRDDEPIEWLDEKRSGPISIYVLDKSEGGLEGCSPSTEEK
jgi:SAM-dependent methyltransferase